MAPTQENVSGWGSYKIIFWWLFQSNRFVALIKIKGWKRYLQGVSESLMPCTEFYLEPSLSTWLLLELSGWRPEPASSQTEEFRSLSAVKMLNPHEPNGGWKLGFAFPAFCL